MSNFEIIHNKSALFTLHKILPFCNRNCSFNILNIILIYQNNFIQVVSSQLYRKYPAVVYFVLQSVYSFIGFYNSPDDGYGCFCDRGMCTTGIVSGFVSLVGLLTLVYLKVRPGWCRLVCFLIRLG
jgi:polyferredoxin